MKPSSMFRHIKATLDKEDIEGLMALGTPADEYNGEASLIEGPIAKLTNLGKKPPTAFQIEEIVADHQFVPFDPEDLEKRRPAFASVARRIATGP